MVVEWKNAKHQKLWVHFWCSREGGAGGEVEIGKCMGNPGVSQRNLYPNP